MILDFILHKFQQLIFSHVMAILDESFIASLPSHDVKQSINNLLSDEIPNYNENFPNVAVDYKEQQICICGSLNDIKTIEV